MRYIPAVHSTDKPTKRAKRILNLWHHAAGLCFWCRTETVKPNEPGYWLNANLTRLGARAATIDHLYSKIHPLRNAKVIGRKVVLACSACNMRRCQVELHIQNRDGELEARIYRPEEWFALRSARKMKRLGVRLNA